MHYGFPSVQSSCSCVRAWRQTATPQGTKRMKLRLPQSRSMWRGRRWPRMSRSLCITVCTVLQLYLEKNVPRPLGTQLLATKPNEILHFDFPYIGLSRDGKHQYLLLLKDDLSGYLWLVPCRMADAAATVDALMRWFAVLVSCCYDYRTEAATSRTKWYNEYRRNSRPSIISSRRIAPGRAALSSPHASKSYVLFVQCYQS
jgi:hypothetical protein